MAASTHHHDYQLFISSLKEARVRANVTQQELADRINNTQTFVSKVERGERRLDLVETIEICEALAISPSAFITRYLEERKALKQSKPSRSKLAKHPQ
jgi:transcriptional regulator with XRE-family HTH domain